MTDREGSSGVGNDRITRNHRVRRVLRKTNTKCKRLGKDVQSKQNTVSTSKERRKYRPKTLRRESVTKSKSEIS